MKTVDEIHNKLYPQSSNEVETLCSHTSDNELRECVPLRERRKQVNGRE